MDFLLVHLSSIQQVARLLSEILAFFGFFGIAFSIGILLRNYLRTKSLDYLIVAGIFFFMSLILFIGVFAVQIVPPISEPLEKITLFIVAILWGILIFLIFLHVLRLKYDWNSIPKILWFFTVLWYLLYSIVAFLITSLETISGIIYTLSIFVIFMSYLTIGVFLTFVYISVTPVKPTDRIELVRKVYILFGIIMIMMSLNQFLFGSLFIITNDINLLSLAMAIQSLLGIIQGLPILYICVFYPELLLISHVQILRAIKLYKKVKQMPIEHLRGDKLLTYLNSIPESCFD
ncbi:MAG: hypothetical protein JSW11_16775 [Candidatus Heimdallarchaeota archaeon]|nr:MAG: hypothetical protein JSW11_16775 [Candidatus Heimdallarchaeota archaeon]